MVAVLKETEKSLVDVNGLLLTNHELVFALLECLLYLVFEPAGSETVNNYEEVGKIQKSTYR